MMDEKLIEIEYSIRKKSRPGQTLLGEKPIEYVVDPYDEKYSPLGKQDEDLQKELSRRIKKRTLESIS